MHGEKTRNCGNLVFAELIEQAARRGRNVRPYLKPLAKRNDHNLKEGNKIEKCNTT
jgi:hypothetical protein